METNFRREEALKRASSLLDAGFDGDYILKKLIKEGTDAELAANVLHTLTGEALAKREAASPSRPKPIITPNGLPREEAAKRATALLDSGYPASKVRSKLLEEGFNQGDVEVVLQRVGTVEAIQHRRMMQDLPKGTRRRDVQVIAGVVMVLFACGLGNVAAKAGPGSGGFLMLFVLALLLAGAFSILRGLSG